jgi:hypothetical protein
MNRLQGQLKRQIGIFILCVLILLLTIGILYPPAARADGGGIPTPTPTVTRTPAPTTPPTQAPTATFTSLPPYPIESSGGGQPVQQQVVTEPTVQPVEQSTNGGFSLGSCLPTGLIVLLAGILLVTFFFARRTRKKSE